MKENLPEKLLSKALIEYQNKYLTIFHLSPTFILISRLEDGKIIEINDYICRTLGYTAEEIIGKTALDLEIWSAESRHSFYKLIHEKGQINNFETVIKTKDKKRIDVLVNVQVILLKKKQCLLTIATDITEKKRAERQQNLLTFILKTLNKEEDFPAIIEEILQAIKEFSYIDIIELKLYDNNEYLTGDPQNKTFTTLKQESPEYRSFVCIPLKSRDNVLGVIQLKSHKSDFFSDESLSFYEEIGSIIGIAYNRILDENKIRESEIQFRGIYENATIGIYRSSPEGKIIMANPYLISMLGYKSFHDLISGVVSTERIYVAEHEAYAFREKITKYGFIHGFEANWKKTDGTIIRIRENAIAVKNSGGKIIYYDGTVEDITDKVKAEQQIRENEIRLQKKNAEYQALNEEYISLNLNLTESLNRIQKMNRELLTAKEKAEESDKLKAEFLRNMSHEIRTPMNGIMGFADLILRADIEESDRVYYASFIKKSCQRLLHTITDIIDYSIVTTGQVALQYVTLPLMKFIQEYETCFREMAQPKNIDFNISLNGIDDEFRLKTDETKFSQIIIKLVDNAINFTDSGAVNLECTLHDTYLEIQVSDTGIGIPSEFQDIIFERFRKVGNLKENYTEGAGLGLTLAKSYVELLHGELWLKSIPGKGSVFCFTLPLL